MARSNALTSSNSSKEKHTVAQAVGRTLASFEPGYCFGVLGTTNFAVTHALELSGVKYIAARHECNAITMADAYSRVSRKLGFATVHAGPGLTNATTGIAEAAKSRTPLLVLAGDVATGDIRSNFFINVQQLVQSVGAISEQIYRPETALRDAHRAATRALRERRTVVLNMAMDVQEAYISVDEADLTPDVNIPKILPEPELVRQLARVLVQSKRPLIIAGRGALLSDAGTALEKLGEGLGALLATSACGHGVFANSPWSLGISGGFSSPVAAELIAESDFILGFGAGLTQWTTRRGKLISKEARTAQIDIDPERLEYYRNVDYPIIGDAAITAEALAAELSLVKDQLSGGWRSLEMARRIEDGSYLREAYQDCTTNEYIDPRTVTLGLDGILPLDRTVVIDAGHFMGWPPRYLRVPDQNGWCMTQSFQSVGLGLATAIGAGLARPDRLTVLGIGDGGFLMSIADLETAVRLGIRLCILVYNDSAYGAEVHHFGPMGYSTDIAKFPESDIAVMASGFGAHSSIVRSREDLEPVRSWVTDGAPGVYVIDAKINPSVIADWLSEAHERASS